MLTGMEAEPTTQTNKSVLTTLNTLLAPTSGQSLFGYQAGGYWGVVGPLLL